MNDFVVHRVVVAFDPVGENKSSIELAAQLAAWWDVALRGVFVEDETLIHLAALPFARHVGPSGDVSQEFDEGMLLHQFEAHANRIRAALAVAAREHEVGWSFDVVRGQPSLATLSIGDQDLLVVEAASRAFAGDFRLDSRWLAEAFRTHRPILLVRSTNIRRDGVVALVQKPGASAERTVGAAARLALAGRRPLTILLAHQDIDAAAIMAQLHAISDQVASHCRVARISSGDMSLERAAEEGSVLVVDADPAINDAGALKDIAARTRSDILFLR